MNKQQEALKLALDALEILKYCSITPGFPDKAITAIREALVDSALDRMAENAREIGLDYGPIVERVEDSIGMGNGAWDMVEPKELAKAFHEALAEQPAQQQEPVSLPEKMYEFVPTPEPIKWHHPECEGQCIACLIEQVVQEAYGSQGLGYLQRHLTSPPASKPWVGLTEQEREKLRWQALEEDAGYTQLIKATEAKLREKNA